MAVCITLLIGERVKVYNTNSNVDLVAKPSQGHLTVWSPFKMMLG